MDRVELAYKEYVRLIERHDKMLDSTFEDFKLYAVFGAFFTLLLSFINSNHFKLISDNQDGIEQLSFMVSLFAFMLIALIASRDLLKQTYIIHLTYNIRKMEEFLQSQLLSEEEKAKYEIFNLRRSWLEKYFQLLAKSYSFFIIIFFLLICVLPLTLFFLKFNPYWEILLIIIVVVMLIYMLLIRHIYSKTAKFEL